MSKNKDGFEPGQELTHDDIMAMRAAQMAKKPQADALPNAPDDVDKMSKADVAAHLEAHGADVDKSQSVKALRETLKKTLFVEGSE